MRFLKQAVLVGGIAAIPLAIGALLYPSFGVDAGSYLMTRNWVLGHDYTGLMAFHTRPPLIGVLLVPLTWMMGDLLASQYMAIFAVVLMAPCSYYLARAWLTPDRAVWAAAIAVLNPIVITLAIGGYLSVLALALSLVLIRMVLTPPPGIFWKLPLLAFTIVGLNQSIPVNMAVIILLFPWALRSLRTILALALGVLATAPWWPWLLVNATAEGISYNQLGDSPWSMAVSISPFLEWGPFIVIVPVLYIAAFQKRRSPVMVPLAMCIILSMLASNHILLNNAFARFMPYIPLFLGIHLVLRYGDTWEPWPTLRYAFLALLLGGIALSSAWRFPGFNMLSDDVLAGMDYIKDHAEYTDKVAAYPHGMGRWTGALTNLAWGTAWGEAPLEHYAAEYEDYKCAIGWTPCKPATPSQFQWVIADWSLTESGPIEKSLTMALAGPANSSHPVLPSSALQFQPYLTGFDHPVAIEEHDGALWVVEQAGTIWKVEEDGERFITLEKEVEHGYTEQGLLNLTFDQQGRAYIFYTRAGDGTDIVERLDDGKIFLEVSEQQPYHNGGAMSWGPDGALYLGIGEDGRPGGVYGSILRLDPVTDDLTIYATGLRNPWRMAWDQGRLWVADVGQESWEEVNLVEEGGDYGWPEQEGTGAFYAYDHTVGCSVTGGVPYQGGYIFSDFCNPQVWLIQPDGTVSTIGELPQAPASFAITSKGVLAAGYGGTIYRYTTDAVEVQVPGIPPLELVFESGPVQVFKVNRPGIPREGVTGRTWPWQGRN